MKTLKQKAKNMTARFLTVLVMFFGITSVAQAEDLWGCEVLLCLSNPAGPTAVGECVPPITKLWRHLEHGGSFPSCGLANGNDATQNYARQVYDQFDPCSMSGLDDAPKSSFIAEGTKKVSTSRYTFGSSSYQLTKSPSMNGTYTMGGVNSNTQRQAKACVKDLQGSYRAGGGRDGGGYTVNVYKKVEWQTPKSPRAIDVFVNAKHFTRVHW